MAHIKRYLYDKILRDLDRRKIVIVYGARQVGKTTLAEEVRARYPNNVYLNGDFIDDRARVSEPSRAMVAQFEQIDLLVIDEAQRIPDIGIKLKAIFDTLPSLHMLVTGSSALEISHAVSEPLTGRSSAHVMYPIALSEMQNTSYANLEQLLIYGAYPEVIVSSSIVDKRNAITNIAANYLFKDTLNIEYIKSPRTLELLLTALAGQVGSEVSIHELSNTLDVDSKTVLRYLDILEKLSIIFPLRPHAANIRKSITKKKKYYFFDLGIRNALLHSFAPLKERTDVGALWENFCVVERMKYHDSMNNFRQYRFWRSYTGDEIDLLEIDNQTIRGFECKWKPQTLSPRIHSIFHNDLHGTGDLTVFSSDTVSKLIEP